MAEEDKKPSDDEKKDKNTVKKNNVSDSSSNLSENNDASKEKKTEKNEPQACSSKSSAPTSSSSETSSDTTPQCDSTSSSKNIEENTSSKSIKNSSFNYCRPQKPKKKEKAGPSSCKDWTEYVQEQSESFDPIAKAIKKENLDYMQGKHFGNGHNNDVIVSGSEDDLSILQNVNIPEEEPNEIGSTFRNDLNEGISEEPNEIRSTFRNDLNEGISGEQQNFEPLILDIKKENLDYITSEDFPKDHNENSFISGSEDDLYMPQNVNKPQEEQNGIESTFKKNVNKAFCKEQENYDIFGVEIKKECLDNLEGSHYSDVNIFPTDIISAESGDGIFSKGNNNNSENSSCDSQKIFIEAPSENPQVSALYRLPEFFMDKPCETPSSLNELNSVEAKNDNQVSCIINQSDKDGIIKNNKNQETVLLPEGSDVLVDKACETCTPLSELSCSVKGKKEKSVAKCKEFVHLKDGINKPYSSDEPPSKKAHHAEEDMPNIEGINDNIVHNITESTSSTLFNKDVADNEECDHEKNNYPEVYSERSFHEKLKQPQVILYDVLSKNCDKNLKKVLSNSDRKILRNFYKKFKAIGSKKRITRASAKNIYNNNDITNGNALLSVYLPEIPSLNKRKIKKLKLSNETKTKKASSPPQSLAFNRMSDLFTSKKGFYCRKCHCKFVSSLIYKKHPCYELQHRLKACVVKLERIPENTKMTVTVQKSAEHASDQSANQADILPEYICKCENKKCNSNEDYKPCVLCLNIYFGIFNDNEHSSQTDNASRASTYRTDVPSTSSTDVQQAVSVEEAASLLQEVSHESLFQISSNDQAVDTLLRALASQNKR